MHQSNSIAPIPPEALLANRIRVKRGVAAAVVTALAEEGISIEELGTRLGVKGSAVKRWLMRMIEGKGRDMDVVSDMFFALGGGELRLTRMERPAARHEGGE